MSEPLTYCELVAELNKVVARAEKAEVERDETFCKHTDLLVEWERDQTLIESLQEQTEAEPARYRAVVEAQAEYIEFLENYIAGTASYLHVHGQGAHQADIDKGTEHRKRIAALAAPTEEPP